MTQPNLGELRGLLTEGLDTPIARILSWRERRNAPRDDEPIVATLTGEGELDWSESLASLDEIRANFFKLDDAALQRRLAQFDVRAFPGLSAPVARLREAANHRALLQKLRQQPNAAEFVDCVFEVLLATPRQAGLVRDGWLAKAEAARSTWPVYRAIEVVKSLQQQAPSLYLLEQSWFDAVAGPSQRTASSWLGWLSTAPAECAIAGSVALGLAAIPSGLAVFVPLLLLGWAWLAIDWTSRRRKRRAR
jgi:hypothetical protein